MNHNELLCSTAVEWPHHRHCAAEHFIYDKMNLWHKVMIKKMAHNSLFMIVALEKVANGKRNGSMCN